MAAQTPAAVAAALEGTAAQMVAAGQGRTAAQMVAQKNVAKDRR